MDDGISHLEGAPGASQVPAGPAGACPQCGSAVDSGDAFCEECGTPLRGGTSPVAARNAVPPSGRQPRPCVECGATGIGADGYCERCGTRQPGERDHVELRVPGAGAASDKGLRHSRNEDAMAVTRLDAGVIAVVSDGVSSSPRPEDASRAAVETGAAVLGERITAGDDPQEATRLAGERAAAAVAELADSATHAPACTYVSAFAGSDGITVGWVGDSRVYWLADGDTGGAGGSALLTEDDSWAGRMVAWGVMSEREAQADAKAHVLTGWLGADATETEPRVRTFAPPGPGAVVVCSDGLWNYLPEADTLRAAAPDARTDPRGTAAALVRKALDAGGHDNVTVVVVPFPVAEHSYTAASRQSDTAIGRQLNRERSDE